MPEYALQFKGQDLVPRGERIQIDYAISSAPRGFVFPKGTQLLCIDGDTVTVLTEFNGKDWGETSRALGKSQQAAYNDIVDGRSIFLTGPGGTGKSYIINSAVKALEAKGKRVAVTASTGIAAVSIGGVTINSFLGTGVSRNKQEMLRCASQKSIQKAGSRILDHDTIVVDEVSMLTGDFIDMMDAWMRFVCQDKRPFAGRQIVWVGDALQLPPVIKEAGTVKRKYCFQADAWNVLDSTVHYLRKGYRQSDIELRKHLMQVRLGNSPKETLDYFNARHNAVLDEPDPTVIYPLKRDVAVENEKHLASLPGTAYDYTATYSGHQAWVDKLRNCLPCDDTLILCEGAKVLFIKNNPKAGYFNGTRGVVRYCDNETVIVDTKHGSINVMKETWEQKDPDGNVAAAVLQYPLILGAACSVHRAQGLTLSHASFDPSSVFEDSMTYVALSRVQSLEGLCLTNPLKSSHIRVSRVCADYYNELVGTSHG